MHMYVNERKGKAVLTSVSLICGYWALRLIDRQLKVVWTDSVTLSITV
jgi:hypothetical protein